MLKYSKKGAKAMKFSNEHLVIYLFSLWLPVAIRRQNFKIKPQVLHQLSRCSTCGGEFRTAAIVPLISQGFQFTLESLYTRIKILFCKIIETVPNDCVRYKKGFSSIKVAKENFINIFN